ncbi:MAG: molybdopterin molybdotransferase MoeA [Clostridiales bacterium]|nr:molybdopterin molybdotransferase MoeA [Clostridiales bacterium]
MEMSPKEKNAPKRREIVQMILDNWHPERGEECIPLTESCGRVVSRDVAAVNTLPVVRSSAMDGIAVKSAAFADGQMPDTESWVYGEDYVRADTGDDFPDAFDAVIQIEQVEMLEKGIRLSVNPKEIVPGRCVRPSGSMVKAGELLLPAGSRITPYRLASLATGGVKEVRVAKKPVVTFLPTGSELIPAGQEPKRGENIESNSLMIREFVREWGGEIVCRPVIKDQMRDLEEALLSAVESSDIVLINGGSSKGSEDYSIPLIEEYGTLLQHYVASAPGRPMSVSLVRDKLVINVPGPTLAALAVSDWAVRLAISYFLREAAKPSDEIEVILEEKLMSPPFMEIYTRVIVTEREGVYYARPLGREARMEDGAGRCNGILVTELGRKGYQAGEKARVKLL